MGFDGKVPDPAGFRANYQVRERYVDSSINTIIPGINYSGQRYLHGRTNR